MVNDGWWVIELVSIVMGVPLDRWMVYFMETPNYQWMMTGGYPSGNLQVATWYHFLWHITVGSGALAEDYGVLWTAVNVIETSTDPDEEGCEAMQPTKEYPWTLWDPGGVHPMG